MDARRLAELMGPLDDSSARSARVFSRKARKTQVSLSLSLFKKKKKKSFASEYQDPTVRRVFECLVARIGSSAAETSPRKSPTPSMAGAGVARPL